MGILKPTPRSGQDAYDRLVTDAQKVLNQSETVLQIHSDEQLSAEQQIQGLQAEILRMHTQIREGAERARHVQDIVAAVSGAMNT